MKRMLLLVMSFVSSLLFSIASWGVYVSPVAAQSCGVVNLENALAYPTNSERFLKVGRQQLDREIQRLQQDSGTQSAEVLKIDPAILQQQRNSQQQEQQLLDRVLELQNRTSPMGSLKQSIN